jgi:hypothetical protein
MAIAPYFFLVMAIACFFPLSLRAKRSNLSQG